MLRRGWLISAVSRRSRQTMVRYVGGSNLNLSHLINLLTVPPPLRIASRAPFRSFHGTKRNCKQIFTILERSNANYDAAPVAPDSPPTSRRRAELRPSNESQSSILDAKEAFIRGAAFEKSVLLLLHRLRFDVVGTGGTGDGGVDFQGWWQLPDQEVRVFGQCKNERRPLQPKNVRDFIGALETRKESHHDTIGIFVSRSPFSELSYTVRRGGLSALGKY